MSTPSRPSTNSTMQQELQFMRSALAEGQEAQNVILRSLQEDMRDVRDRLTLIEAKDVITRIAGLEVRMTAQESSARDMVELTRKVSENSSKLQRIEELRTEASGVFKVAKWFWPTITAALGAFGAWVLHFFEAPKL